MKKINKKFGTKHKEITNKELFDRLTKEGLPSLVRLLKIANKKS